MTIKLTDEDDRKALIRKAEESGECPVCGGEMDVEGYHERDSTYDKHFCRKCEFGYSQIETWDP